MTTAGEYALVVTIGVISALSVTGGLLINVVIWTLPALRTPAHVPLASLGCTDILVAILPNSMWIVHILHPQWEPPPALCWITAYVSPVLFGVSVSHMLCIALQRYFKICTYSTRLKSTRVLVIMLLLTWSVPFASFLPLHVGEEVKRGDRQGHNTFKSMADVACEEGQNSPSSDEELKDHDCVVWEGDQNSPSSDEELKVHDCVVWEGDQNSPSSGEELKDHDCVVCEGDQNSPSSGEELKDHDCVVWEGDQNSPSSDEEQKGHDLEVWVGGENSSKGNDIIEPDEPECVIIVTAAAASDPADTKEQQRAVPGNSSQNDNNRAESQITKMMLTIFVVFNICCMPLVVMVIFSSKVPAEVFTVGGLPDNMLRPVSLDSHEAQEIQFAYRRTCWDEKSFGYQISDIQLVENDFLQSEFLQKQHELSIEGRSPKELIEEFAFLDVSDKTKRSAVCNSGLTTALSDTANSALGEPSQGVTVWRCPDLCIQKEADGGPKNPVVAMFKLTTPLAPETFLEFLQKQHELSIEGRSPKELIEEFAFLDVSDKTKRSAVCTSGLTTALSDTANSALGEPSQGVTVWRCPDLCIQKEADGGPKNPVVAMFKGKEATVPNYSFSKR
uniref:G-protein coupled receptors family 1 profile domain-containing protein n=1 Tax=Branchiostoma floridae TaxID=7739 RepID=C4A0R8_BRAFL|eukprot:XP_002585603.1 hypothetical protein BRAFLDRAFT_111746 [Branchiostoma floridae]